VWRPALLAGAWLAACAVLPAAAQDDVDEALEGFEQEEEELPRPTEQQPVAPEPRRWWDLTGTASLGGSWAYRHARPDEYQGLTRLQARLALQLDLELPREFEARIAGRGFRDYAYALEGRGEYGEEVRDTYERELEFQELWLGGPLLHDLDLHFGRQIVAWGRSDNLRVLDVLNPIDAREPGLVDIEDLKLPVTMTRLEYFRGEWSLEGLAIHETRFDEGPVPGSDFFPPGVPDLPEERPGSGGGDTQWAARLRGIFPGWDVSFHWARYWHARAHAVPAAPSPLLRHARVTLLGASGQVALGDWLLKSEIAHLDGLDLDDRRRIDSMAGLEYLGIDEVAIALEVVNRHILRFEPLELDPQDRNAWECSLSVSADFIHDRLHATLVALGFGERLLDGGLLRAELQWEIRDALAVSGGVVLYESTADPPLDFWGDHDRLFLQLEYAF
jgi:hypothetical protein